MTADLLALDDDHFAAAWYGMSDADRAALEARVRTAAIRRYVQISGGGRGLEQRRPKVNGAEHTEQKKVNQFEFKPEIVTLGELLATETKAPEWIIDGLLPPGVMLLAGRPKVGKSRAAAMMGEAVSQSGEFLGRLCRTGTVVYLDLENARWRISKRWRDAGFSTRSLDALRFILKWRRGNRDALLQLMDATRDLRLIVIDVWVKFRAPADPRQQAYDQDYGEIAWLQEAAAQRGIAVVLVHHLRKAFDPENPFESIAGSVAVLGAVDNAMLLLKHEDGFRLAMQGRDIEDATLAMQGRGLLFECLGQIDPAAARVTEDQKRYLRAIEFEPMTNTGIVKALDVSKSAVSEMLSKLEARDLIKFLSPLGWTLTEAGRSALL